MKFRFSTAIALSAAFVAGCAAYYSVFGLSQLFAGASVAVIIMASSLEFSKVVAVSLLQRYWKKLSSWLKIYLSIGVFILVCITSAGIYGFLSNAYQKTASAYEITEGQLSIIDGKKSLYDRAIADNEKIIETKRKRVEQLTNLRINQENRLDNATSNTNRNRARNDINSASTEIQKLNKEIDDLNSKNSILADSSNSYATKSLETKANSDASAEIGPLRYLSQLTGYSMDKVVNWFILLLIFVFDPLAVALVIATNRIMFLEKNEIKENENNDKGDDDKPIELEENNKTETTQEEILPVNEISQETNEETKIEEAPPVEENPVIENPIIEEQVAQPITDKEMRIIQKTSKREQKDKTAIHKIGSNKFMDETQKKKIIFKRN